MPHLTVPFLAPTLLTLSRLIDPTGVEEPAAAEAGAAQAPEYGLGGDWGGVRAQLEEDGYSFGASLWFDVHSVTSGGVKRDTVTNALLDLTASFDLAKLAGLEHAVVVANAYAINGRNPSDLAGDWQAFSNSAIDRHVEQLGQLYYEQYLLEESVRIKLGKADANVDFAAPVYGGEFVSSSAGMSPTIFTLPTYPDPATCVAVFWQPSERCSLGAAVFDGATNAGYSTGSRGPSTFFGGPSDLFFIGEGSCGWAAGSDGLEGRVALGGWHHTGDFTRFSGADEEGTEGWYALLEQELTRTDDGTLAGFVQFGGADEDVAEVDRHIAAGVSLTGCCGNADDAVGVYCSQVCFSDGLGTTASEETAFEVFYRWQARSWLVVKPDLQYITNPGGDASLDDAVALTLRLQVDF